MVFRSFQNKDLKHILHTDDLISHVKVRECLWNPRDAHYGDKFAKQHAWYEVCVAVIPKFNDRPFEEQSLIAKAVQARWKGARDAFMKCNNDNKKNFTYREYKGKSSYIYYNLLTFLKKVKDYEDETEKDPFGNPITVQIEEEDTTVLSNDDDDTEDIDFNMDMNETEGNPDLSNEPEVSTDVIENTVEYCEPGTSNTDNQEDPLVQPAKKRAKRNNSPTPRGRKKKSDMSEFETKLLKILSAKNESKANLVLPEDDQNFFNSLAPMINNFNNYQKLHFRSKVLEIVREVQTVSLVRVKNERICGEVQNTNNEDNDNLLRESVTFQY